MSEGKYQEGAELDDIETRREKMEADGHERLEAPCYNLLLEMDAAPKSNFAHEMLKGCGPRMQSKTYSAR
jgi:hypothetical protein